MVLDSPALLEWEISVIFLGYETDTFSLLLAQSGFPRLIPLEWEFSRGEKKNRKNWEITEVFGNSLTQTIKLFLWSCSIHRPNSMPLSYYYYHYYSGPQIAWVCCHLESKQIVIVFPTATWMTGLMGIFSESPHVLSRLFLCNLPTWQALCSQNLCLVHHRYSKQHFLCERND